MKRKIIYLIVIVSMVLTIGLFSIKKANAYDMIFVSDGLDSPNAYQGVLIAYSLDLGDRVGYRINASIGDSFQDILYNFRQYYEDCCTYMFLDFSPNNDQCILLINFYYTMQNGQPYETNMEVLSFSEDTLQWQIRQTYGYLSSYDRLILFYWTPFRNYCSYQQVQLNQMVADQTPINFTLLGSEQQVPIYSEPYESSSHDEDQSPEDMFFRYMRSNTHANEVLYLSNVDPSYALSYYVYAYNQLLTYRYNYFNNIRTIGYYSGYDLGYSEGLNGNPDVSTAYAQGKAEGERIGYNRGYDEGLNSENAIHPFWAIISSIGNALSSILAIQLGRGITIGTLVFIPLFFAVLGFVLWIWRHN